MWRTTKPHIDAKDVKLIDDSYKSRKGLILKFPYRFAAVSRTVLRLSDNPNAASPDPKDFYDNSLLKELGDSAVVKELYRH